MIVEPEQLKKFLLDAGLINAAQFDAALKKSQKQNLRVEDVLLAEKLINQDELIRSEAYVTGIPFVNLEGEVASPEVLKIIPEPIARTHNIVSFRKHGNSLEVAMLDTDDLQTISFITKKTGLKILPRLTTTQSIKHFLSQYHESLQAEFSEIIQKEAGGIKATGMTDEEIGKVELEKQAQDLPIIKIVDALLKHAILQGASDIHIEPAENSVLVRYRIDGILKDAMVLPLSAKTGIVARLKVLSNLRLDEHRLPQDGRFKVESDDYKYSVRVSILPVFNGEKVVLRLLPETSHGLSLEALGLSGGDLEKTKMALKKTVGMVLITGPTGSGKTTTLYSMMELLNSPRVNISTVEDPIEYRMPRINQTQVNSKIGLSFANGLRALLRQDPNIIMVGEIRDNETAGLAINAALTGHLVLSTLHTNSAAGAVPRLLDMQVEPFLLTSTLNIIIAQRLVRRLVGEKESYVLSEAELESLAKHCDLERVSAIFQQEKIIESGEDLKKVEFFKPKPSQEAADGYKGRIGIYEILEVSEQVKDMVQQGTNIDDLQKQAQKEGMRLIIEDGLVKAAKGLTSLEEVMRVITE